MLAEKEILKRLYSGSFMLPPLAIRVVQTEPELGWRYRPDAIIEVSWQNKKALFVVEIKALSTPMIFGNAVNRLRSLPKSAYLPLLVMPYLSEAQLRELEGLSVSGIDLCGNGVVIAPGKFSVFRSGGENRFPSSAPIKNVYRKNSAMVSRAFLARPDYSAVEEIRDEVNLRNILVARYGRKPMSFSTVSKVLKTLENDVIIGRDGSIRLLQPDTLLKKLSENYAPVNKGKSIRLKVTENKETIPAMLGRLSRESELPVMAAGVSSVADYAVMQRGEMLSVYCPDIGKMENSIPGNRTDRFPDLELIETEEEAIYFDARERDNFRWASPVQVYLELMAGDKRDRETAEQVKAFILATVDKELR